jgi:hypothetical protein
MIGGERKVHALKNPFFKTAHMLLMTGEDYTNLKRMCHEKELNLLGLDKLYTVPVYIDLTMHINN